MKIKKTQTRIKLNEQTNRRKNTIKTYIHTNKQTTPPNKNIQAQNWKPYYTSNISIKGEKSLNKI